MLANLTRDQVEQGGVQMTQWNLPASRSLMIEFCRDSSVRSHLSPLFRSTSTASKSHPLAFKIFPQLFNYRCLTLPSCKQVEGSKGETRQCPVLIGTTALGFVAETYVPGPVWALVPDNSCLIVP